MGLIDRVREDQLESYMQQSAEDEERARLEVELEKQRVVIITNKLEVVAAKLDEPLEPVTEDPVGLPRYYILGDIVIMVQRFMGSNEKPDPAVPHLLTFSYCTYLIGLDANKKLVQRKIGTLKFLDFAGIAKAITEAPPNYTFDAPAVKLYLP